jgi:DNA N-6-adenine-methyltransferase (Dam)
VLATPLFSVGMADVADTSDDYYTPRWIFDAAGLAFDMDVSAPVDPSRRTCPARRYLTPIEDGLVQSWEGLVWMNPPYSKPGPWITRFIEHGNGLALCPGLKRASWLGVLLGGADAIALMTIGNFGRPDGSKGELPSLLILAGCGEVATGAVGRIAAADKYLQGAYHVRPAPESGRLFA